MSATCIDKNAKSLNIQETSMEKPIEEHIAAIGMTVFLVNADWSFFQYSQKKRLYKWQQPAPLLPVF